MATVEIVEDEPAQPVKLIQLERGIFNLKNSVYYEDDYKNYFLSFYIPDGKIIASYGKEGIFYAPLKNSRIQKFLLLLHKLL